MSRKSTQNTFCFLNRSCCNFMKLFFCISIELNNDGAFKDSIIIFFISSTVKVFLILFSISSKEF